MTDGKKQVVIDVPSYKGPDRRGEEPIVIAQCRCHPKHEKVLADHEADINELKQDLKERRAALDERIATNHRELEEDIMALERSKLPNRLFYLFIGTFSVLFIVGIITVYSGLNAAKLSLTEKIGEIKTEVKVVEVKVQNHVDSAEKIEDKLESIDRKIDDHVLETKNGMKNHGG